MMKSIKTKTILIVEDHPVFIDAMSGMLKQSIANIEIQTADSIKSIDHHLRRGLVPSLILLDLHIPGIDRLDALMYIKKRCKNAPVFIMSGDEDVSTIQYCLENGADGYIKKSYPSSKVISIIQAKLKQHQNHIPQGVITDQPSEVDSISELLGSLSSREMIVLTHIKQGKQNKMIAVDMNISLPTVKAHTSSILRKLDLNNRSEIIIFMNKFGPELNEMYEKSNF